MARIYCLGSAGRWPATRIPRVHAWRGSTASGSAGRWPAIRIPRIHALRGSTASGSAGRWPATRIPRIHAWRGSTASGSAGRWPATPYPAHPRMARIYCLGSAGRWPATRIPRIHAWRGSTGRRRAAVRGRRFRSVVEVAVPQPGSYECQAIRRRSVQRAAMVDRVAPERYRLAAQRQACGIQQGGQIGDVAVLAAVAQHQRLAEPRRGTPR